MDRNEHVGACALVRKGQMLEDRRLGAEEWDNTGPHRAPYTGCILMMEGRLAEEVVPGPTMAHVLVGMNHRSFDVVDAAVLGRCDCGEEAVWTMLVDVHHEHLQLVVEVATCWCGSMQNNGIVLQQTPLTSQCRCAHQKQSMVDVKYRRSDGVESLKSQLSLG